MLQKLVAMPTYKQFFSVKSAWSPWYQSTVLILVLATGCNGEYQRQYPNDFVIAKTDPFTVAIFYESRNEFFSPTKEAIQRSGLHSGVAIGPYVDKYYFDGRFLHGHCKESPNSELAKFHNYPGYFIIDTKTHEVWRMLDYAGYQTKLASLRNK